VFERTLPAELEGVTEFALALISATVGSHLNVRRLRNAGKRLLYLVVADSIVTPAFVFAGAVLLGGASWLLAIVLAAIAVESSPGTVLSIVRETRAKGVFVTTLLAAVALTDVACIVLFELARVGGRLALGSEAEMIDLVVSPIKQLAIAAAIGGVCAVGLTVASRRVATPTTLATASILAIFFSWGVARYLGVSSILACMFLGVTLSNLPRGDSQAGASPFESFEPALYAVFFTIAGVQLEFHHLVGAGFLAIVVFLARALGKVTAAMLAMRAARTTPNLRRYLGLGLLPHASIAVGLMLLLQSDPAFHSIRDPVLAVVLSVVTLSEIVGPILTRFAVARSGEVGNDRARLIDFIQEHSIVTGLEAHNKEEAITRLVDVLIRANHLSIDRDRLVQSVLQREEEMSTCLGSGAPITSATAGFSPMLRTEATTLPP
jgi:Kef-type K+ transport system membrane component KefB